MTSERADIPVLSDRELREVLERAREERWRELALVSTSHAGSTDYLTARRWPRNRAFRVTKLSTEHVRELASIDSLIALDLRSNQLGAEAVRLLASLTNLTALDLSENQLGNEGISGLGSLTNLTTLYVAANQIGAKGARSLGSLMSLRKLDLNVNQLGDEGARALNSLTNLTTLDLNLNQVGDKGAGALSSLTNLTELNLASNQLGEEGIRALGSLSTLTALCLNYNKLGDEKARALSSLTNLTTLDLSLNQLGASGARALGSLANLTQLNIESNQLGEEGAKALARLTGLTSLNLAGNGIGEEGAKALARLTNLTSLDLQSNGIGAEGAKALAHLTGLTSLDLARNEIGDEGAKALARLTGLTSLWLWDNRIGEEGAKALARLTGLTSLNLARNAIGEEGAKALARLTGLTSLWLWNSGISDKGAKALVARLKSLTALNLLGNKLTKTHPFLSMPSLSSLDLRDNPVDDIPAVLVQDLDCLPTLRAYWAELEKGAVPNDVVKVLLVGNGCVGKTTLAHCLKHKKPPPKSIDERTHGIELQNVGLELQDGIVDVRLWDFGGQERYHAMHRLFLRHGAFFLLLWAEEPDEVIDEETDEERYPVGYWLHMIRHLTDDPKVLLVKNKTDLPTKLDLPPGVDKGVLAGVRQVKVSAKKCRGIEGLKRSLARLIQKARPRWQYQIPKSWQGVSEDLDRLRQPDLGAGEPSRQTISLGQFEQICAKHGVEHRDVLLQFLHDTGEVFHRGGSFDDSVIVDQGWFIDKLYRLFDRTSGDYEMACGLGGVLKGSYFQRFWPGEGEAEWATYFDFMLQTRMAFELDHHYGKPFAKRTMVVPALLPAFDDKQLPHWKKVLPDDESRLRLEYHFLHRALVERIVVELSALSEGRRWWRDGLEITDPKTGCLALLRATAKKGRLYLRLRGERQVETFARVRRTLHEILERDPDRTLVSNDGKTFVDLAKLDESIRLEARRVATAAGALVEREPYNRFRPFIDPPKSEGDLVPKEENAPKQTRIFISCSHSEKDQVFLAELEKRLRALKRQYPIEFWHNRQILAGAPVADEIYKRLDVADVVLLLISADFTDSDECFSNEMTHALKKYQERRGTPVPILIRPEGTWDTHEIGRHQVLPKNGQPISKWADRDDAWADVTEGLRAVLARARAG